MRLAEASSNTQAWSETYDYESGDVFKIQEEVAKQVATALNATLAGGLAHVPREAAIEPFLRAEFFYNRRAQGDISRPSNNYPVYSVSHSLGYGKAWVLLSGAYSLLRLQWRHRHRVGSVCERLSRRHARRSRSYPDLAVGYAIFSEHHGDIGHVICLSDF